MICVAVLEDGDRELKEESGDWTVRRCSCNLSWSISLVAAGSRVMTVLRLWAKMAAGDRTHWDSCLADFLLDILEANPSARAGGPLFSGASIGLSVNVVSKVPLALGEVDPEVGEEYKGGSAGSVGVEIMR